MVNLSYRRHYEETIHHTITVRTCRFIITPKILQSGIDNGWYFIHYIAQCLLFHWRRFSLFWVLFFLFWQGMEGVQQLFAITHNSPVLQFTNTLLILNSWWLGPCTWRRRSVSQQSRAQAFHNNPPISLWFVYLPYILGGWVHALVDADMSVSRSVTQQVSALG